MEVQARRVAGCRGGRARGEGLEERVDPPEHRQAGSHPGQRVHRGRSGHEWSDLDGPAVERLPSAAAEGRDRPGAGDAMAGEVAADGLEATTATALASAAARTGRWLDLPAQAPAPGDPS
jgi:hypothetical protein